MNRIIRVADDAEDHEVKTMFTSLLNELGLHTKLFFTMSLLETYLSQALNRPENCSRHGQGFLDAERT